ncbi:hypothetical protein N7456_006839 [Penicillium angulare]|uniref:Tetraspanin Tsp3 n=1 Tax=Penicillium angulare TaxID=116970 RepID=A0A9W9KD98_9EURO|nr:hypothetical protein N7456_006839 [Penicillium angulare]
MPFKVDVTTLLYMAFFWSSWARTAALLLPLPTWVPAIATLISPITVLAVLARRVFFRPLSDETPQNGRWNNIFSILDHVQTIISTSVATLALAYLFPDRILSCNLDQQWQAFFQSKNSHAIRSIQDEFQCCGLRSLHDRAWPFKDRNHGDNACELQLGYQRSCFAPWREQQQNTSWMIFAAVVFMLASKIAFVQLPGQRMSWMSAQSGIMWPAYQRISHPRVQNEEDNENGVHEEGRRTFLTQSNTQGRNDWEVD